MATTCADFLEADDFLQVVRMTPLVSIDLIVSDYAGRVLVGNRRNRPALGTWFVPGGRICKNERLDAAFTRIVDAELGISGMERSAARFGGLFEHLYSDNFAGADEITTHNVVIAYFLTLENTASVGRFDQHSRYIWLRPEELLAHDGVHENTKAYFR
ncbi:GDP-mannose mannosyl hydrolase [Paraburkholderia phymatum]|uniref:GDP-mannose mannosyl hydrolase n=1 Tax=Paraburkholderia phymatum TaxID=148447 RepID=A0ACC6TVD9_9BURK